MNNSSGGTVSDIRLKTLEFVLWAERLAYSRGGHVYHFRSRSEYLPEVCSIESPNELRLWFIKHIEKAVSMIGLTAVTSGGMWLGAVTLAAFALRRACRAKVTGQGTEDGEKTDGVRNN